MLPIQDYLLIIKAHLAKLIKIIFFGIAVSAFYAFNLPPTYQTTSVIQVLQPAILAANSQSSTNSSELHRLQVIKQQLLSRGNLKKVIENNSLYSGPEAISMTEKILLLRSAAQINEIQSDALRWRPDSSPTSLEIIVSDSSPEKAAIVANELANMLIALSRENNASQTQKALVFFESESIRVGAEISKLDAEISKFKQINVDLMPAGLTNLRHQLSIVDEAAFQLDSKIVALKSVSLKRAGSGNENQYANGKLEQLEQQRRLATNKRTFIIAQLARGPEVERTFIALTREMKQISAQLTIINKNRSEAKMNEMLEASRQQSNFKILDHALIPKHPVSPNKKKVIAAGVILSIAFAIALIIILEYKNGIIRTSSQMELQLGLEPVMIMPTLRKPRRFFTAAKQDITLFGATQSSPQSRCNAQNQ